MSTDEGYMSGRRHSREWPDASGQIEIQLLLQFLELSGKPVLNKRSWDLCLRTVHFLHACGYNYDDTCAVLALASKYFQDLLARCGARMGAEEAGHIMVLVVYIAHSYALDETCPLSTWHRCLSNSYCTLGMMSSAVLRLMGLRGYVLRLEDEELESRYSALYTSPTRFL